MPTILVVDDEPNIIELSRLYFEREGFTVVTARNGSQALAQVESAQPDLMLLDIMMPEVDGWEVCRRLRAANNTVPIIVVTARGDDVDKIVGLELGADDYITKPFNPREVVARAKALLRRAGWGSREEKESEFLQAGSLTLDVAGHLARAGDKELTLRPREWDLLLALVRRKGQVLSRNQLLDDVWGFDYHGDTRTVDVHVAALREKLRETGATTVGIETVWSIGYKLVVQDE